MGYTTEFSGSFTFSKPLTNEQNNFLTKFANTRRVKRNTEMLNEKHNGEHGLNGSYGIDGEYFVGAEGFGGQDRDESVIEYNQPPSTQPGLWCQWIPDEDGTILEWDGSEKFYKYTEWLEYLIENFFNPWGIELNGEVKWRGEDFSDLGIITIENNKMVVRDFDFDF